MPVLFLMVGFGCLVQACDPLDRRPQPIKSSAPLVELAEKMLAPRMDPTAVSQSLGQLIQQAQGKDKELLEKMKKLVDQAIQALDRRPGDAAGLAKLSISFLDLVGELAALHPDDFDLQIKVAASVFTFSYSMDGLGVDGSRYRQEGTERARDLAKRFPTQGRAFALLGHVVYTTGGDELESLRLYARCLELDRALSQCRQAFQAIAEKFTREHCTGDGINPSLSLYPARKSKGGEYAVPFMHDKLTFYRTETPAFTAADVEEIAAQENPESMIELKEGAAHRFEELTAKLALHPEDDAGYLAVFLHGKVLLVPRVANKIQGGRIQLTGSRLQDLCKRTSRRLLPQDLEALQ